MMEIPSSILGLGIKDLIAAIRAFAKAHSRTEEDIGARLSAHLKFIDSWSSQIQFLGMSEPAETDKTAITLRLSAIPRQFRAKDSRSKIFGSASLLSKKAHHILLGDPGSGKTTTVKQICRALLHDEAISEHDKYQYPIVVRLREMKDTSDIWRQISDLIGLKYESHAPAPSAHLNLSSGAPLEQQLEYKVSGTPLSRAVCEFLDRTNAVLFVDGIDEVLPSLRRSVEKDLSLLAHSTLHAKVICTCRSGDYARRIDGYTLVEIMPLSETEIEGIVRRWATNKKRFFAEVAERSYADMMDRPLFLAQMIFLFNNLGRLPARPTDLYRRLVTLMLEKWDDERGIKRVSTYATFEADEKLEFLSRLAFYLLYKGGKKVFDESELVAAYSAICEGFRLSRGDALSVVREIESHTGIIVKGSV